MKTCSRCHIAKPFVQYWSNSSQADGYHYYCIECAKYHNRKQYDKRKKMTRVFNRRSETVVRVTLISESTLTNGHVVRTYEQETMLDEQTTK